jgi:hypothetical protein
MSVVIPPPPTLPVTPENYQAWDVYLRAVDIDARGREAAAFVAASDRQIAAEFSDAGLMKTFTAAVVGQWGAGTQASELSKIAESMLAQYRKLYPASGV